MSRAEYTEPMQDEDDDDHLNEDNKDGDNNGKLEELVY